MIKLLAITFLSLTASVFGQLPSGETIGIDFASDNPVFGTPNDVDPANGTNFNKFDRDINDGVTAFFVGTLVDLSGNNVPGVTFRVRNNMGKRTGRTAVDGSSGPGAFNDATIYRDCYGGASVSSSSRADFGVLADDANLVMRFSGLDDDSTYTVSGGFDNNNDNFNTTWDIAGQSATTNSNGGNGYITLSGLTTDGSGNLEITVTKSSHLLVAGLTLRAEPLTNPDGNLNFPAAVPDAGYTFPNAFPGLSFSDLSSLDVLPSQPEKLFATDGDGVIWMIPDVTAANPTQVLFLDRTPEADSISSSAMNGIAFHPDFENNGYFYIVYISPSSGWTRLSRFTVADPQNISTVNNNTEHVLIEANFHSQPRLQ